MTDPYFTYKHTDKVVPDESCPAGSSSVTGSRSTARRTYPAFYDGALFFADYSRNCIWAMPPGPNGDPDPTKLRLFAAGASTPST